MIDVVIPSKTNLINKVMLENCITTLRQSDGEQSFNVMVIESGEYFACGQDKTITYDRDIFCYNHALNLGINESKNEWVVLINNDLIFRNIWMSEIIKAHKERPDIESFSPWNDMWGWHSKLFDINSSNIIEGYNIGRELCGWCIVAKKSIFDMFSLSERVNFWYSDNVYADSLIEFGIKHALVISSKVDHIVSQTKQVSAVEARLSYYDYITKKGV